MFQESLEEVDRVKSEYTAKLIEASEKYRVTLKENEELKEKVAILFKLGRSYIDRAETGDIDSEKTTAPPKVTKQQEPNNVEDDDMQNLSAWETNKFRGFRRVSPTAPPQQSKEVPPRNPPTRSSSPGSTSRAAPASGAPQTGTGPTARTTPTVNERLQTLAMDNRSSQMEMAGRTQYCHYFTNFGKCNYEENTGNSCKFDHKVAPVCQRGTACTRSKCMYTHPNTARQNNAFLGRNSGLEKNMWPQMMNPYMNPWSLMNPFQQQTIPPFQQQGMGWGQN